jgi:predicted O-methyltransferase YrrM
MPTFTNYHRTYENAWRHLFFERAKWDPQHPRTFVEIGGYEGSSAWWIMQNLLRSAESRLYCIDAWPDGDDGDGRHALFLKNIDELPSRAQIEVIRDWSQTALRQLLSRGVQADVLYIDGGHEAPTVLRDLVTGFDLVKKGGIVICDDYLWDDPRFGGNHTLGRPKIALDAFTTIYADKLKIVRGMPNTQVFFQKVAD